MAPDRKHLEQYTSDEGSNIPVETNAIALMPAEIKEEFKTLCNKINIQSVETEAKIQEQNKAFNNKISEQKRTLNP
jgi:hypothetical protein